MRMKKLKYVVMAIVMHLFFISCHKGKSQEIESALLIHFTNFEAEAVAHGLDIDIFSLDINGYIQNIETRGTLGQCKSYSDGSQQIVVDEQYWNRISNSEREYLVFHELGHCILEREHNDERDENGNCISIMQSGNNGCKSVYNDNYKAQLLNELFSN
jgi:hypothetical protein